MARIKKTEKKIWYSVIAPKSFHNQMLGEIPLSDPSKAVGRIVPINLSSLIKDPRRQHITIKFLATESAGEKVYTSLIGYEISPSFIRRMMRKGGDKIDYSFATKTADNKSIRIKFVIILSKKLKASVGTALRKKAEELIKKEVQKEGYEEALQSIIAYKMQNSLKKQLTKIYPLRTFEIKYVGLEKLKKPEGKEAKPAEEKPTTEEKRVIEEKLAKEEKNREIEKEEAAKKEILA